MFKQLGVTGAQPWVARAGLSLVTTLQATTPNHSLQGLIHGQVWEVSIHPDCLKSSTHPFKEQKHIYMMDG